MLTDAELAAIRAQRAANLPGLVDVRRRAETIDSTGQAVAGYTTTAAVPCRLAPAGTQGGVGRVAARLQTTSAWSATFGYGTDVQIGDQLVAGGKALTVIEVLGGQARETARVAVCEERR